MRVHILGHPILGLLDSGATRTIVGQPGVDILKNLGLKLDQNTSSNCTVANGQRVSVIGTFHTPVSLMEKVHVIDILVAPELSHTLILGVDFWKIMDIVPDLKRDVWHFGPLWPTPQLYNIEVKDNLTLAQRDILNTLLDNKFKLMGKSLGYTTLTEHEIITDARPIKQRYYPVSPAKQKIIDEELKSMLAQDIIEPSKSSWSSPILLVPKRDGGYRFCVDYRALNAVTKKDAYPLPYISAILDRLRDAKYLSSMDIKSAYWQVPVKESCRELTAFTVPGGRGLYHFKRMPFGLSNAPATWQRLIDTVLGPELEPYVFVYLDDIIVISPDFDIHVKTLSQVFDRLYAAGLTVSQDKCKFCRPSLKYLGYIVDANGLRVDPEKIEAILNVKAPTNITEVRRFLGMASWYRRFVPDFSSTVAPLTRLTCKNCRFRWTDDCDRAFKAIRDKLISAPILTCPDFSCPFVLQTDASGYGIGAVLTQQLDGEEKVICFLSRSLTKQERNFSTTERECLSVIWAVEKLRHYLEGTHFTVVTDHASLIWLNRLKDPTGRLARWAIRLQPFNYTIIHRKGKENIVPDYLSRSVPIVTDSISVDSENDLSINDPWYIRMIRKVNSHPRKFSQWRVDNNTLYKYVECKYPELSDIDIDSWKRVIPRSERNRLISIAHDTPTSGHLGVYKTFHKLSNQYYWPKMRADVANYIRRCKMCTCNKPEQKAPPGFMVGRPYVTRPWELISADLVGPLPKSSHGYLYILVVVDYFSKFPVFFPLRSATGSSVVKSIEDHIFMMFGVPTSIIVDNGVQFRSREFTKLMKTYNIQIRYTANYHPQANPTERVNRVLKTMLSSFVGDNQRQWDILLPKVACAIRSAKHEVIKNSPYFVNFGREMVLQGDHNHYKDDPDTDLELNQDQEEINSRRQGFQDLYEDIQSRLFKASQISASRYNFRRRHVQYITGQQVYRRNFVLSDASKYYTAKLAPKFIGPFVIHKRVSPFTYQLKDLEGNLKGIWNVKDLKPTLGH